jgi:16S rRNA (adenine1518-N6/adenine1519-N6)-dimethyltransferase
MALKPLKKFGQNYLTDKNIVNKMIQVLEIKPQDSLIEIGPGKGFITEELYELAEHLIGIEIDTRVLDMLSESFPKMVLINNDFVKVDLKSLNLLPEIKIIGNIPFNQTGNIIFKLFENIDIICESVFIIPHDIAKRIVAKKRTKEYGILTILFTYFSTSRIVSKISPNVFFPKPNMDAAIIHIKFNKSLNSNIDNKLFIKVVKAAFGNRRKTLNNSLRNSIFGEYDFSKLELDLNKRAEELSVDDFLKLSEYIQNNA